MFKEYRKIRKYTQEELAELINVDTRTIQRIEQEKSTPTLENFKKLVKILKISDKEILEYIKNEKQR